MVYLPTSCVFLAVSRFISLHEWVNIFDASLCKFSWLNNKIPYLLKFRYKVPNGLRYYLLLFCPISSYRATQRLVNNSTHDMYMSLNFPLISLH